MLNVSDLSFDYQEEPLLNKVSFDLPAGSMLHLRGANGSGKTTLLKLLAGLYHPHQGRIVFKGQAIAENLAQYQQEICYVGHKPGINPYLSIRENCMFDTHYALKKYDIQHLAKVFQLQAHLDKLCGLLSAGLKRQVGLLRLWMTDAPLWLLDEPLVALDERAVSVLMHHIQQHRQAGGIVVLSSHQSLPLDSSEYQEYCL